MKTCPKCGRTSPPALRACPRCKAPLDPEAAGTSAGSRRSGSSRQESDPGRPRVSKMFVMGASLAALIAVLVVLLFMNMNWFSSFSAGPSGSSQYLPQEIRPSNFNELLGTWSGREINGRDGWTFSFSDGYNVSASGPEGWYRGKAAIHWEIGTDGKVMRVPPGASVLDVDIEEASAGVYVGKTSVGAFDIRGGSTLRICSGEPGKTRRPESFEPTSGIRCFELTKTAEAPPPLSQQAQTAKTDNSVVPVSAASDGDVAAAREAFRNCVAAYKAGNISEAKKYIGSRDLPEMEQSGMLDMAMGMMSGLNIDEFVPTQQGDRMIFRKSEKQGDMTSSMSINMVREDGQWKLGK